MEPRLKMWPRPGRSLGLTLCSPSSELRQLNLIVCTHVLGMLFPVILQDL